MTDVRAPLTEEDLRDVKQDLVQRVANQDRYFGGVGSEERAEQLVVPIVEKIARDHDEERRKDLVRPAFVPQIKPVGQAAAAAERDDVEVKTQAVGQYDFESDKLVLAPELAARLREREELEARFPRIRALRQIFHRIRTDPEMGEWRERVEKVMLTPLPPGHTRTGCKACFSHVCWVPETMYRKIATAFMEAHGDPLEAPAQKAYSLPSVRKRVARVLKRTPARAQARPSKWIGKRG